MFSNLNSYIVYMNFTIRLTNSITMKVLFSAILAIVALSFSTDLLAQQKTAPRAVEGVLKRKAMNGHPQLKACMSNYIKDNYYYVIEGAGEVETFLDVNTFDSGDLYKKLNKKVKVVGTMKGEKVTSVGKEYSCAVLQAKTVTLK